MAVNQIYNKSGCQGKNQSPELEWSDPPAGTKSFALTVIDTDARNGKGWLHWAIYNIPFNMKKLMTGASSKDSSLRAQGIGQIKNDFGEIGYGGPCPPVGDSSHHYHFRLYALKKILPHSESLTLGELNQFIHQEKLADAEVIATYRR